MHPATGEVIVWWGHSDVSRDKIIVFDVYHRSDRRISLGVECLIPNVWLVIFIERKLHCVICPEKAKYIKIDILFIQGLYSPLQSTWICAQLGLVSNQCRNRMKLSALLALNLHVFVIPLIKFLVNSSPVRDSSLANGYGQDCAGSTLIRSTPVTEYIRGRSLFSSFSLRKNSTLMKIEISPWRQTLQDNHLQI